MSPRVWIGLLCAALLAGDTTAGAAKFNRVLDIGDRAPEWKDLPGVDGKPHSFADFEDAKVVVLFFTRNHCPVAQRYEPRFVEFTRAYRDKGVAVVAVNASRAVGEELPKMTTRAREKGLNFAYLRDAGQATARAYGATVTPHIFVLDSERKIAYMGAFDDQNQGRQAARHYVRDAVEALLAGREVEIEESLQHGCPIGYQDKTGS